MKSDLSPRLLGKWYQIARSNNTYEKSFIDVFIYASMFYKDSFDLLYVGVKCDRSKVIKKLSLKISFKKESLSFIVRKCLFRKKIDLLFFDEREGFIVISDKKMKFFSIYSKNSKLRKSVVESYMSKIDFLKNNNKTIVFYSNNIID